MKYVIKNAAISLNGNSILDEINIEILEKSHIGIVGKNGAGKTTLLNALIHNEMLEEGIEETPFSIQKIGTFTIGYLEQITFASTEITLLEEIRKSFPEIIAIEKKMEEYLKKMEINSSTEIITEYTSLLDRYEILGGYTYKKEYETMLKKFGFTEEDKTKKLKNFSGGEKTKLAFLKLLLQEPDILLLDEPTNHLDIEAIIWLENYLKNYKKAFVVVSHDRMFLDNIVNTIYDVSYKTTQKYVGNYSAFEHQKKENYERNLKNYERQQKEIKRLRELYEKFRYNPSKASMAMSKLHMIERMEKLEKPRKINEKTFKMNLTKMEPSGNMVLSCKDLEVGYDKTLAKLNLEINKGQKIAIIGANGTGKSTLLKTIEGLLKPLRGSISFGYHVNKAYFDQNLKMLDDNHTILEEFKQTYPNALEQEAKSALGAFLFSGEDTQKQVSVLSGGEKVRLLLCKILYSKPNFLLLDEPTNHMDLVGKERLESILEDYKGTILFVSHDRYFVKKIATDLIIFEQDNASVYHCNYEDYLEKKKNETKEETNTKNNTIVKPEKEKEKNKVDKEKQTSLRKIEQQIEKLEKEKKELNEELLKEDIFTDYKKASGIKDNLTALEEKIQELEKAWEEMTK